VVPEEDPEVATKVVLAEEAEVVRTEDSCVGDTDLVLLVEEAEQV
jgi:hypothetical protein